MRKITFALAACMFAAAPVFAQNDPGQTQAEVGAIFQQLQENMNNAGVTPQELMQQLGNQMREGTFDPQAFRQQLQDQGVITPELLDRANQLRNQVQNQRQNLTQTRTSTLQQLLNASDEEWTVLAPRIQRVVDLSNDLGGTTLNVRVTNPAAQIGQGARGGQLVPAAQPGQPNVGQQPAQSPTAQALADLRATLQNPDAPESQVAARLTAYRQTRDKVKAELASAQTDLVTVLTLRQEAILLNMSLLE